MPIGHVPSNRARIQASHGILLVPDSHGDMQRLQFLTEAVKARKVDWLAVTAQVNFPDNVWLALEMIPHTHQKWLDQFMKSPVDSPQYKEAISGLDEALDGWGSKFGNGLKPCYDLLQLCKESGVRVYGIDCSKEFRISNEGQVGGGGP